MGPIAWNANNPVTRWRGHIDPIRVNLVQVQIHRTIFREVVAAVEREATPRTTATWRNHYAQLYVQSQMMAIRRIIRGTADQFSLSGLLRAMERHPAAMTAEMAIAISDDLGGGRSADDVVRDLLTRWADESGCLDPRIPRRDRNALMRERRTILDWADQTLAHIQIQPIDIPTFGDLDRAIDHVTDVFQRYGQLLTAQHYAVDQIIEDLNWREALSRPLFPSPLGPPE